MTLNNLLIASDFSKHADFSLQKAASIAKQHGTTLYFIHVLPHSWANQFTHLALGTTQHELDLAQKESEETLSNLLETYAENLPAKTAVLAGKAATEIIQFAKAQPCELIVMGAHGRYYINDYVLGTTSSAIVRQSHLPVLLVKQKPASEYQRILVATDFSNVSKHAIEFAYRCFPDATFQLLHIVDIYYRKFFKSNPSDQTFPAADHDIAQDIIEKMDDFLNTCEVNQKKFEKKIIGGYSADAIVLQSERWRADLIAFGTQGHSTLHYFLMGSVAKRILHLSHTDMLAVPPHPLGAAEESLGH